MKFPSLVDKRFCKTPVTVTLYQDGNDEDGEPQEALIFEGVCNYQDSAKTVLTADKRLIQLAMAQLRVVMGDRFKRRVAIIDVRYELFKLVH